MSALIQATLERKEFAVAERIVLTLSVTNSSATELLLVADPRRGGDSLRFTVRFPDGQEPSFTVGEALQAPGVRQVPADMAVPPGVRQDLEFDLAQWVRFQDPGKYRLKIHYEWKKGESPWSGEISFTLNSPAGVFLEAVPLEAARTGYYGLLWTERNANQARVLLADYRIEKPLADVRGAREITTLPAEATPGLSMSPGGQPFSERWLAWVVDNNLHALYYADTVENQLPMRTVRLPSNDLKLARPPLAEAAPDNGRPGCMIGLVSRATGGGGTLQPIELNRRGEARTFEASYLSGPVVEVWGIALANSHPTFIVAAQVGKSLELTAAACPWQATRSISTLLLSTEAELLGGDVRATLDGQARVGLVVKRGRVREQVFLTLTSLGAKPEPVKKDLRLDEDANIIRTRLDERGRLHLIVKRPHRLSYVLPDENLEITLAEKLAGDGRFFDLLLRPDFPATLVCYDRSRGPIAVKL